MDIYNEPYEIPVEQMGNAHKLIGEDWMLICAKDGDSANGMTASWGALGELWGKHVAVCFIRPQRYTFGLAEENKRMSLAFFDGEYRDALKYCGSHSGRNESKLPNAGLDFTEYGGVPMIRQAKMTVICRKLYADDIKPECFVDTSLLANYKAEDYHRVYVMEIEKVLVRKQTGEEI